MMIFCPMNLVIDMMKQWSPSGLRPVTIQSFLRRVISRSAVEITAARDSPSSSRTAYLSMSDNDDDDDDDDDDSSDDDSDDGSNDDDDDSSVMMMIAIVMTIILSYHQSHHLIIASHHLIKLPSTSPMNV